jgi:hypothetical protein
MSILSWNHTRKGTPMKQSGSYGFLMITVMMVRSSYSYKHKHIMTEEHKKSYLGRIPSQDFWDEAYQLFLEFATPEELEEDILKRETLQKINTALGYN